MASTETTDAETATVKDSPDLGSLEAGLDALETVQAHRTPVREVLVEAFHGPTRYDRRVARERRWESGAVPQL